jgi:hypothetical protein
LELENRRLLQRLEAMDGSSGYGGAAQASASLNHARLSQLEARLDAIEITLRELIVELRRHSR